MENKPIVYCCGFMFSEDKKQVLLIRKNKPEWQKGLFNGIGGKIEEGESIDYAMKREFIEEVYMEDISLYPEWNIFLTIIGVDFVVHFFKAFGNVQKCSSSEDEKVYAIDCNTLIEFQRIRNLDWIIPMALDSQLRPAVIYYTDIKNEDSQK